LDRDIGSRATCRQILLVGFMASGKSTVGRILAGILQWRFVDSDLAIEERAGASIPEIFRDRGEPAFREIERDVIEDALNQTEVVIATGGGWASQSGTMDSLPRTATVVWLKIGADVAVRRARWSGTARPLLDVPDAVDSAARLLAEREPAYGRAHWQIDVEHREPREIAQAIARYIEDTRQEWH
jgi:shikimate kinase